MKLLVIDGNSIANRAFYGIKNLSASDGTPTNAIYGFLSMLEKIKVYAEPDAVAIAFDLKAPTFRHKMYNGYKANRKGMPEELAVQMPILKEIILNFGYKIVECEGYEADDILGTLSLQCQNNNDTCVLATGDRDSFQLVSENVSVYMATTKFGKADTEIYTPQRILDEYGVTPIQMVDIKAIQGDTSDAIPGVKGIGKKGAEDLIKEYGSLENIYENLDNLNIRQSIKDKLIEGKDMAFLSQKLGKINRAVPIPTDLSYYIPTHRNDDTLYEIMYRLGLQTFIKKFNISSNIITADIPKVKYKVEYVDDEKDFLLSIQADKKAYFIYQNDKFYFNKNNSIFILSPSIDFTKSFFANEEIEKYTYNLKAIAENLIPDNTEFSNVKFDCYLAGYILSPSAKTYDLKDMAEIEKAIIPEFIDSVTDDNILNCALLLDLCQKQESKLIAFDQISLLQEIEIPLAIVLAEMEYYGIKVNPTEIEAYGNMLSEKAAKLEKEICTIVGYDFNINSPKQLGVALFEKLQLPHGKKTKTGYSTSADVLDKLKNDVPIVSMILEYRTLVKLKSTYCDAMVKLVDENNRVHSYFKQTETRTGRISSTEPNLQNIPIRTEIGKELRKFFCAEDDMVLVDADYSQIELRVLAHISKDEIMTNNFVNNEDIHKATASRVFGLPENMITPIMRSRAKAVNFGIIYGMGAYSLSEDLNISIKEADNYIKTYLEKYSGISKYLNNVVESAKKDFYVTTLFNRRRYLDELKSKNKLNIAFGERVAKNAPIQGTAADIIKIAMIKVRNRLKHEKLNARLILQVHDELIVECATNEAEKVKEILQFEMENAIKLSVPLVADAKIGKNWLEAKG